MWYDHEQDDRRERVTKPLHPVVLPTKCTDEQPFDLYLNHRHLDPALARGNGWYLGFDDRDPNTPRIVIPSTSLSNSWPYYQARATTHHHARYLSPKAPRGDALAVVWPEYPDGSRGVVIVEGPMDALAAAGEDYLGVGLMGNTPSDLVVAHLLKYTSMFDDVYLIPDQDALEAAMKLSGKLWKEGARCSLQLLPNGSKDLADMSQSMRQTFFARLQGS